MARASSKHRIQQALFELLGERSIDKITVSEVVARAGVSRTTYYRTYYSLQSVVDDALDELFGKIRPLVPRRLDSSSAFEIRAFELSALQILMLYQDHAQLLGLLLNGSADMALKHRLFDFTMATLSAAFGDADTPLDEMNRTYVAAGMTAVICRWVADGCSTPVEEVLAFIVQAREDGLRA